MDVKISLPLDLYPQIFDNLNDLQDYKNCAIVCTAWNKMLGNLENKINKTHPWTKFVPKEISNIISLKEIVLLPRFGKKLKSNEDYLHSFKILPPDQFEHPITIIHSEKSDMFAVAFKILAILDEGKRGWYMITCAWSSGAFNSTQANKTFAIESCNMTSEFFNRYEQQKKKIGDLLETKMPYLRIDFV